MPTELSAPSANGAACGNAEMSGEKGKEKYKHEAHSHYPGDTGQRCFPSGPPGSHAAPGATSMCFPKTYADAASAHPGFFHMALPWAEIPGSVEAEASQSPPSPEAPRSKW